MMKQETFARRPSQLIDWLSGGDLRSDGLSNEAAAFILQNPDLIAELLEALYVTDDVVRGRAADALEKVARSRPDLLHAHRDDLIAVVERDPVAMVRWHLAMIFGHLAVDPRLTDELAPVLLALLRDDSVAVRCWAIVSLCIFGRRYPAWRSRIALAVSRLQTSDSAAVRSKVCRALPVLSDETARFPKGWVKSDHLGSL